MPRKIPAKATKQARKKVRKPARQPTTAVALRPRRDDDHARYDWLAGRIHEVRGGNAMLDADLAELYQVETRAVVQAVKRNRDRFPEDFVFQLTLEETENLRSQNVMSSGEHGGRRHLPYAFTEQGIAMLSSVLRSKRAIQANIFVMRAFVSMRRALAKNGELSARVEKLEEGQKRHRTWIELIAEDVKELRLPPPDPPKRRIGFPTKAASAKAGA